MRLLLLTANISEESKEIARAITGYMSERYPDVVFRTLDVVKMVDGFKGVLLNKGYSLLCRNMNRISNKIYKKQLLSENKNYEKTLMFKLTKGAESELLKKIEMFEPSVVLCTHSLPSSMVCHIKSYSKELFEKVKIVSVVHNYNVPVNARFFKTSDYIITPNDLLSSKFIHFGINMNQNIIDFGVPTNEKFEKKVEKTKACNVLKIKDDLFNVVCYVPNYSVKEGVALIKNLCKAKNQIMVSVVCVKNQNLRYRLSKFVKRHKLENVRIYGITNNLDLILSACDVCICHPQGLIVAECANKCVPIVATPKLVFEEVENVKVLQKENAVLMVNNFKLIDETVDEFIENPSLLDSAKENILKFSKPNATKDLCKFLHSEF